MKYFILTYILPLAVAQCDYGTRLNPRQDSPAKSSFGYDGLTGPLAWHGLSKNNRACAVGKYQSPIIIRPDELSSTTGDSLDLKFSEDTDVAEIENLGYTLEIFTNGSLKLDNKSFGLSQFHFHTPSEHRILSQYYPMEAHFVYQSSDDSIAVLGLSIDIAGPSDSPLDLWSDVFAHVDEVSEAGSTGETGSLKFDDFLSHVSSSSIYQYSGSLTTPPCSEGISWNYVSEPTYIDMNTYRKVKSIMKFNSRYTQNKLGKRNLLDNARKILDK